MVFIRAMVWLAIGGVVIATRYLRRLLRPLRPGWTYKLELWVFLTLLVQRRYLRAKLPSVRGLVVDLPLSMKGLEGLKLTEIERAGCPAWRLDPKTGTQRRMLHFHGGGYILGSGKGCLEFLSHLCRKLDVVVETVDYRLAPEGAYPAALQDARGAYEELLQEGIAPSDILVAGESAGGGLALALGLQLRDEKAGLPGAFFLFSPWVQLDSDRASYATYAESDILAQDGLQIARDLYLNGHSAQDPLCSPVFGDYAGFPPTYLLAGGAEIFVDDIVVLGEKMKAAGVDCVLEVEEHMPHTWLYLSLVLPNLDEKVRALGDRLDAFWPRTPPGEGAAEPAASSAGG